MRKVGEIYYTSNLNSPIRIQPVCHVMSRFNSLMQYNYEISWIVHLGVKIHHKSQAIPIVAATRKPERTTVPHEYLQKPYPCNFCNR
jgi:hypothetical protein